MPRTTHPKKEIEDAMKHARQIRRVIDNCIIHRGGEESQA